MTERTVETGYQDYRDCRVYRGDVFRMWYPRGNAVVFGVWSSVEAANEGGGARTSPAGADRCRRRW